MQKLFQRSKVIKEANVLINSNHVMGEMHVENITIRQK